MNSYFPILTLLLACHVVVDEIEHEISKVDPKKILELDGFRIDPQGNQMKRKTVSLSHIL